MRRITKVFVLTHMYRDKYSDTSLCVIGVYSTMAAAKAELAKHRELILADYEERHPDNHEVYENHSTLWGISLKDEEAWDELQVEEKEVSRDS